ncbi:DUF718-domain-containing protein [Coniochaeta hoffmannii]|uniref:DUF718-domain-containing protein n=1 Tax=Coniochaeta hoffmannii TaxID=91930 RepID=A0AA38RX63_9PEZI|nr:DUF718-domain-containing protein [Coniochaeta hoffmannii]
MWSPRRASTSDGSAKGTEEPSTMSSSTKVKNPGRRYAQIVKLKPEHVEEYKKVHAAVWPEVLKQIKDCKMEDYSIYLDDDTHILFAYFKYVGYDFEGDMERMRENPRVREWWKMTDGWQESMVPGAKSSEAGTPPWWKPVEEVFHVD